MTQAEQIKALKDSVAQLEAENRQLVSRNLQLSEQLCIWYELRQRVNWLKEEMLNRRQNSRRRTGLPGLRKIPIMKRRHCGVRQAPAGH